MALSDSTETGILATKNRSRDWCWTSSIQFSLTDPPPTLCDQWWYRGRSLKTYSRGQEGKNAVSSNFPEVIPSISHSLKTLIEIFKKKRSLFWSPVELWDYVATQVQKFIRNDSLMACRTNINSRHCCNIHNNALNIPATRCLNFPSANPISQSVQYRSMTNSYGRPRTEAPNIIAGQSTKPGFKGKISCITNSPTWFIRGCISNSALYFL